MLMEPLLGINRAFLWILQRERQLNEIIGIKIKVLISNIGWSTCTKDEL